MKRSVLIFTLVFGTIGLGLLVGAGICVKSTLSFMASSKTAGGRVVAMEETRGSKGSLLYKPVVEWTGPDGKMRHITGSVASSPPSYSVGDAVSLRYDPANPDNAQLDTFMENWFPAVILGILGTVFTGVGSGFGIYAWKKKKRVAWLRAHGTQIAAKFTGVVLDRSFSSNGRNPWRLTAQWQNPDGGAIHTFRSDAIWFDPTEFVRGETLDVLIKKDRPSVYLIDLAFLPDHAG